MYSIFILLPEYISLYSLDWDQFMWSRIGDEGVTALADLRVLKKFKTLK